MRTAAIVAGLAVGVAGCVPIHHLGPGMRVYEPWQTVPGAGKVARTASELPLHGRLETDTPVELELGTAGPTLIEPGAISHAAMFELPALGGSHQVAVSSRGDLFLRVRLLNARFEVMRDVGWERFVTRYGYRLPRQTTIFLNAQDLLARYVLLTTDPAATKAFAPPGGLPGPVPLVEPMPTGTINIELRPYTPQTAGRVN